MRGDRPASSHWTHGCVIFSRAVMDAIDAHLVAAYPNEGCGYVVGPADANEVTRFEPLENLQDQYHAMDPVAHPRTARTAYVIHPLRFERAVSEGLASGMPVKVIVHSHADHDAYFSAEDVAFAIVDGVPTRDCAHLVVSVQHGLVHERKLFALDAEGKSYVQTPITMEERTT